jgi:hypothetical protein
MEINLLNVKMHITCDPEDEKFVRVAESIVNSINTRGALFSTFAALCKEIKKNQTATIELQKLVENIDFEKVNIQLKKVEL